MNEETFKSTIVVPFLRSAGFDEAELVFEKSFTIQLGRAKHVVNSTRGGRLDILCRRDATNIMVAELKAPSEKVDASTSKQAISYARLLQPIAPFVLISNGVDSRLFDTITATEIERIDAQSAYRADIATELRLRYEALASFVGYSFENLRTFSAAQAQIALKPFVAVSSAAPVTQLRKKYVPSLVVERASAVQRVFEFIGNGGRSVLACVGESGCGKTVLACRLLEILPAPTLFYSGTLLGSSLLQEVALDFNLTFSAQESEISLLRRIASLTSAHNARLIIIVDAIDEWRAVDKCAQLDRLAVIASQLNIKVVLTCKRGHWAEFLMLRGVSTPLSENLDLPELGLDNYTEAERESAVTRLTTFLNLRPATNTSFSESLRHPFTMRVVAEVAASDGVPLESVSAASREVLRRFLDLSFAKMLAPALGQRVILAVGRRLLEHASFHCEVDLLRRDLGLSLLDELPTELFLSGLLLTHTQPGAGEFVTFYHSHVRDYVLAILIGRLGTADSADRRAWIERHMTSGPGLDAILYFVVTGSPEEQRDAIEALLEGDAHGDAMARFLAWRGDAIAKDVLDPLGARLVERLLVAFRRAETDETGLVADCVVEAMSRLLPTPEVEIALVSFVEIIARSSNRAIQRPMWRIADALQKLDSSHCTARLIVVLRDPTVDGYVRRYVAAAIAQRSFDGREELFMHLVTDGEPNVLRWIRSWYAAIETPAVRDRLLDMHDRATTSYWAKEMCVLLEQSSLPDTAEALFQRIDSSKSEGWICRALAKLRHPQAEGRFVELLRRTPFSETGASVMIAMSEMPSTAYVAPLLELVTSHAERFVESVHVHWLALALGRSATPDALRVLAGLLSASGSPDVAYCVGLTLLKSGDSQFVEVVIEGLADGRFGRYAHRVLSQLDQGQGSLPNRPLELLEDVARTNPAMSITALAFLGHVINDTRRLAMLIREVLPTTKDEVRGEIPWHPRTRRQLRGELDEWLAAQLRTVASTDPRARTFLKFAEIVGGRRTVEALHIARAALARATSQEWVASVEHEIYRSLAEDPG